MKKSFNIFMFFMRIFILLSMILNTGCHKEKREPLEVKIVSMATPVATLPENSKIIYGVAILDLKGVSGVNTLTGIKICLVDSDHFEERFNATKEYVVSRHLCSNIYNIEVILNQLYGKKTSLDNLLSIKEDELEKFNSVKWSSFT